MVKCKELIDSRETGATTYNTGKPCKHGHLSDRLVRSRQCVECKRLEGKSEKHLERSRVYYQKNAEARRQYRRDYYENNKEKHTLARESWKQRNPQKVKDDNKQWREENKEYVKEKMNEWLAINKEYVKKQKREYYIENVEHIRAYAKQYRKTNAKKLAVSDGLKQKRLKKATPKWVDIEALALLHAQRPSGYHLDHEVPLKGKNVCGLNVPWNLKLIPAQSNMRKHNFFCSSEWHFDPVSSSFIRTISPEAPDYEKPLDMAA